MALTPANKGFKDLGPVKDPSMSGQLKGGGTNMAMAKPTAGAISGMKAKQQAAMGAKAGAKAGALMGGLAGAGAKPAMGAGLTAARAQGKPAMGAGGGDPAAMMGRLAAARNAQRSAATRPMPPPGAPMGAMGGPPPMNAPGVMPRYGMGAGAPMMGAPAPAPAQQLPAGEQPLDYDWTQTAQTGR